jgi:hypothetical protein
MNQLIKLPANVEECAQSQEIKGRYIYQTNDNFRRLATVMEHPEFREFYNTYMTDWDTAKTMIMFMKMYEAIEKHAQIELTPYQKLAVVKDMIDDTEKRELISKGISEWTKEKNNSIQQ